MTGTSRIQKLAVQVDQLREGWPSVCSESLWVCVSPLLDTGDLSQLLRLLREYPREPFLGAIGEAEQYGLYDLDRVERMILRCVQRDFFLLEGNSDD